MPRRLCEQISAASPAAALKVDRVTARPPVLIGFARSFRIPEQSLKAKGFIPVDPSFRSDPAIRRVAARRRFSRSASRT
jgi:hypothetical protein